LKVELSGGNYCTMTMMQMKWLFTEAVVCYKLQYSWSILWSYVSIRNLFDQRFNLISMELSCYLETFCVPIGMFKHA